MLLRIDTRAGSQKLLAVFGAEAVPAILEAGDIAFTGNGPDGDWQIGIEYKRLEDVVGCIKTGRFTGTQLPAMMRLYDLSFLLVEGIGKPDRHSGQLVRYLGKQIYGCGIAYQGYDNFLTAIAVFSSLAGKPCIVKTSATLQETEKMIRDVYALFQKPWSAHKSMSRPDQTKLTRVSFELEVAKVKPEDSGYAEYWLRKALFQVERLGWDLAGNLACQCISMENALQLTQKEWQTFEQVGPGLAKRIYETLHGHPDPALLLPKKRKLRNVI